MSFVTSWKLALIFVVLVPLVLVVLLVLATVVHPLFVSVFNKYDELNQEVQEDLSGIRVVKAYGRQEEEKAKFNGVSTFIYKNFTKAEQIMAFNSPLMRSEREFCVDKNIIVENLLFKSSLRLPER